MLQRAQRKQAPLKGGFSGASGSGKTYSALLMASGMAPWDKIAVIDTENHSAELYSHLGGYFTLPLTADFTPEKYIDAIRECEKAGMKVIIIDSITHEWDGKGGLLEAQASLGGRYQDWAKITPRHQAFVDAILQSPCHVFTTVRRKQDYDMSKDASGKTTVTKVGTKEVTREGFEYELTFSFEISQNHLAKASKDRTGLFMGKPEFVISAETGKQLLAWHDSGVAVVKVEPVAAVETEKASAYETIRGLCKALAAAGKLEFVRTTIKKIGNADKLDDVAPENYDALMTALGGAA